jgi:hypothetical protein
MLFDDLEGHLVVFHGFGKIIIPKNKYSRK